MNNTSRQSLQAVFRARLSEFSSGSLGLTLITISLAVLLFVIVPLREAGFTGRVFSYAITGTLMALGALAVSQSRIRPAFVLAFLLVTGAVLGAGRAHPTPFLHQLGSLLVTVTMLIYFRIVLLVMFRGGPVTWSRIQGGVCAYLLLGMAWASAFQLLEQLRPGSFQFVTPPADIDQLTSKLIYFSFCTLTTIGSDIKPLHPFARSLTMSEAIVGQLFPAIFIGALVAMAMQSRTKS
ncbi:MAG TPA: ion channel [Terriglobia bacterium]